jgi:uncharacterized membrane protein (UPF0127 family)
MRYLSLLIAIFWSTLAVAAQAAEPLLIHHRGHTHRYTIELAKTPEEQRRGLMHRRHLAPDAGMLFLWEESKPISMWMKDTYVSLDMLFLDERGVIVQIEAHATPLSEKMIESQQSVRAVLELPGGTVEKTGIAVGDRVEHPTFAVTP